MIEIEQLMKTILVSLNIDAGLKPHEIDP